MPISMHIIYDHMWSNTMFCRSTTMAFSATICCYRLLSISTMILLSMYFHYSIVWLIHIPTSLSHIENLIRSVFHIYPSQIVRILMIKTMKESALFIVLSCEFICKMDKHKWKKWWRKHTERKNRSVKKNSYRNVIERKLSWPFCFEIVDCCLILLTCDLAVCVLHE